MGTTLDTDRVFDEKTDSLHLDGTKPVVVTENENQVNSEDEPELQFKITPRLMLSILGLCLGYNGAFFSLSLVGPILNYINEDVGPVPYYIWISTAWTMTSAVSVTVGGRMMDIFGRRYLMVGGNFLCVIGCIVGGTANSVGVIICGTTILALGCGPQLQATACIAELVPKKLRPVVTGLVAFSLFIPSIFGTPIAYSILRHSTWRWSFWVTLIIDAVACIVLLLFYFPPTFHQKHKMDNKTKWQEFIKFDFIGTAIFAGSVISLLLGINFGGSIHPWKSASTITPIVIGALGLIVFGFYEALIPHHAAFIPKPLLLDFRGFGAVILAIGVSGMLLYSLQILWPVMVQTEYATDLTMIGWISCSFAGGTTVGAMLLGFVIAKIGHGRLVFVVLVALMTAFIGGMAGMNPHTLGGSATLTTLAGISVGAVQLVSITMIILQVRDEFLGVAVGLAGTARFVGGAIATTIYSTVLNNKVAEVLPTKVAGAVIPLGFKQQNLALLIEGLVSGNKTELLEVPGISTPIISAASYAVKQSYVEGFRLIYLISIAFGGGAILAAACTKNFDNQLTNHVAVELNQPNVPQLDNRGSQTKDNLEA